MTNLPDLPQLHAKSLQTFLGKIHAIFSVHVATLCMLNLPLSRKVSQPQFHWKERQLSVQEN